MRYQAKFLSILLFLPILVLGGCAKSVSTDYGPFREKLPRSVLVIPPINESIEANASYIYLSTLTRPLAEAGYYVFPVDVVANFMKANGLPTPHEMNSVSLRKIKKIFAADAVLYLSIENWGQKYIVLSSNTVVKVRAKLVDVDSGQTIWQGGADVVEGSHDGGDNGIVGMLVAAAVEQIVESSSSRIWYVAQQASSEMIFDSDDGFLLGPYHPKFAEDLRGR